MITDAVRVEWNEAHDIVTISLLKIDRSSIDAYVDVNIDLLRDWNKADTIYKIQDLSHEDVNPTPYLRNRLKDIYAYIRDKQMSVRVAVVLGTGLPGQIFTIISRVAAITSPNLTQRFFTNMSQAHAWIKKEKRKQAAQ